MNKCKVDGCCNDVRVKSLNLCYKHYVRFKKYGDVNGGIKNQEPLFKRFWNFVQPTNPDECWIWQGQILSNGYGRISVGEKSKGSEGAHRVSWKLANNKEIPDGMVVMHSCDNPSCVNPNHLSIGTHKENCLDMIRKGRKKTVAPKGEYNGKSKLTSDIVKIIRQSTLSNSALGRLLGVSESTVRGVRIKRTWSHIE